MIKEITISEDKTLKINSNLGWVLKYRSQFGHDILPDLLPAIEAGLNLIGGAIDNEGNVDLRTLTESNGFTDAMIAIAGSEFATVLDITWALAKNADPEIPAPEIWITEFDDFPLDIIIPELISAIVQSCVSSKNRERLNRAMKKVRP